MKKTKLSWVDACLSLALSFLYVSLLLRTTRDLGYARDEGFYFQAASSYARWFELLFEDTKAALEPRTIDAFWSVNHEHPGLVKSLFSLSNLVLQRKYHLFAMEGTSYRFPAILLAGLLIALVYLWGTEARGRIAGLCAAVLLAAMPRFFYHAHLACFDVPIVAMWTLTAYCYYQSLHRKGLFFPIATGIAFGLALDTKHNAWFLPIFCAAHALAREAVFFARRRLGHPATNPPSAVRTRSLAALCSMAVLGPLVFYALWPWIWHDTVFRLKAYASFHLNHEYYNMEFLGQTYFTTPMPRAYAWVMTAATVPAITLLLFFVGVFTRARARLLHPLAALVHRGWLGAALARMAARSPQTSPETAEVDLLWLLGLLINYAAWLSPNTPIFGGTKHWMTAYPFLALFAGTGFDAVVRTARRELLRRRSQSSWARGLGRDPVPATALLGAMTALAPIVETAHSHPWGLSSYTPLVGGAASAATLGLNRTFWGYTTGSVVDFLNQSPRGSTVYVHDTAWPSWEMLLKDGRVRRDIRAVASVADADYGLYHHEMHMRGQEFQNWVAFSTARPAYLGGIDGVPVIHVYERPRPAPEPPRTER